MWEEAYVFPDALYGRGRPPHLPLLLRLLPALQTRHSARLHQRAAPGPDGRPQTCGQTFGSGSCHLGFWITTKRPRTLDLPAGHRESIEASYNKFPFNWGPLHEWGFAVEDSGDYFLKPFTHAQMWSMLEAGIIGPEVLEGLMNVVRGFPGAGAEIFVNCRLA